MVAFRDQKSDIFGLKSEFLALFLKSDIKKKHVIIIIYHFCHFSFCNVFLNVARYTLVAISAPPILPLSMRVFLVNIFFGWFFVALKRNGLQSSCWQHPMEYFAFFSFPRLTCLVFFEHFPRQKINFEGPIFWLK